MWANAQRDCRPAKYRWHPLFNATQFAWCLPPEISNAVINAVIKCSNAAKMRKPLKFAGVPRTRQQISAVSRPKFTVLWGHVEEVLVINKFFFRLSIHASAAKIQPDTVVWWCQNGDFLYVRQSAFLSITLPDVDYIKLILRFFHRQTQQWAKRDAVWDMDSGGPNEASVRWGCTLAPPG